MEVSEVGSGTALPRSSECESDGDFTINDENIDTAALDLDMMSVFRNRKLEGDLKWFQYYKALERYLYKRDPSFIPHQFTFDIREGRSGEQVYVINPSKKKKKSLGFRLLKYTPSIVGPLLGAALTALIRS
jgi:hypothetical protein